MSSPRGILSTSHTQEHQDCFNRSIRLESSSYESTRTDLSSNSRDVIVADQWVVLAKIGEGSFGEVFEARDINTGRHYAIKRERSSVKHPQLKYESKMYDILAGGMGIPQCHWYGQFDGFDCIVMDLLGPNLSQVRQNVSCMELDIAVELLCQMVSTLEHIHNRGVIVRDIKPDNFLFPATHSLPEAEMIESSDNYDMPVTTYKKSTCKQVFEEQWNDSHPKMHLVDFGLACYWRDPDTGAVYPDTKKHIKSKTGTARYASINVHRGKSHSRRDDMESLGYILLDLLLGTLPWTGVHAKNSKAGWDRMRQLKVDTFMSDLCAGLPKGVLKFVEYPRTLQFAEQPDYELMRQFLKGSLPNGPYSDIVKSPFGGEAKPIDNYDQINQEQKPHHFHHHHQHKQQKHNQQEGDFDNGLPSQDYHHDQPDLFDMDEVTRQLSSVNVTDHQHHAKSAFVHKQQHKESVSSLPSFQKLLKRNRTKKIGWNTHKHDNLPWNPQTDWTNEGETETLSKSWGDDQEPITTWGLPPTATVDRNDSSRGEWNINPVRRDTKQVDDTVTLGERQWKEISTWEGSGKHNVNIDNVMNWRQQQQKQGKQQQQLYQEWQPKEIKDSTQQKSTLTPTRQRHSSQPHRRHYHPPKHQQSMQPQLPRSPSQQRQQHQQPHPAKPDQRNHRNSHPSVDNKDQSEETEVDGWGRKPGSTTWFQKGR